MEIVAAAEMTGLDAVDFAVVKEEYVNVRRDRMKQQVKVQTAKGILDAEIVQENAKTVWLKLPDGHTVKKNKRCLIQEASSKTEG